MDSILKDIKTIYQIQPTDNANEFKLVRAGNTFDDISDVFQNEFNFMDIPCIIVSCLHSDDIFNSKTPSHLFLFKIIAENNDKTKIIMSVLPEDNLIKPTEENPISVFKGKIFISLSNKSGLIFIEEHQYENFDIALEKMIEFMVGEITHKSLINHSQINNFV